ncbi:MAG: catechol 2,3-dioxygenase-like lactoylglutathione lyase family enzyme [Yoonia sp.]|jgi:catechol 2,3-dioxygenase-like lactoylglutathione lyase family enzyme
MNQSISLVAVVVRDYDDAIKFYVEKLGFDLVDDTYQPEQDKRWVVVKPKGDGQASILLAKASSSEQQKFIGNQSGGRVFLFLQTDDFDRDYNNYKNNGIEFIRPPKTAPYGTVAVFSDLYGNLWDLVQFS